MLGTAVPADMFKSFLYSGMTACEGRYSFSMNHFMFSWFFSYS